MYAFKNLCLIKEISLLFKKFFFLRKFLYSWKSLLLVETSSTYRKAHCLHIASRHTQTGNLWFSERKLLTTKLSLLFLFKWKMIHIFLLCTYFFFFLVFLSQPFANHRNAGEGGEHFFNYSLPLPPTSQALRH